jgi:hypothetical protein
MLHKVCWLKHGRANQQFDTIDTRTLQCMHEFSMMNDTMCHYITTSCCYGFRCTGIPYLLDSFSASLDSQSPSDLVLCRAGRNTTKRTCDKTHHHFLVPSLSGGLSIAEDSFIGRIKQLPAHNVQQQLYHMPPAEYHGLIKSTVPFQ